MWPFLEGGSVSLIHDVTILSWEFLWHHWMQWVQGIKTLEKAWHLWCRKNEYSLCAMKKKKETECWSTAVKVPRLTVGHQVYAQWVRLIPQHGRFFISTKKKKKRKKKEFPPYLKQHCKATEAPKALMSEMRYRELRKTITGCHHSHHFARFIWMSLHVWDQHMFSVVENRIN